MNHNELKNLKEDIDKYFVLLTKKHPNLIEISESLEVLFYTERFNCLIDPWFRSVEKLLVEINKDIENIKNGK